MASRGRPPPATPRHPDVSHAGKVRTVSRTEKSKRSRFARIDNAVLQDERLSFRARGVLAFVLSKPDGWQHSGDSIAAAGAAEGRDAIRAALQELRTHGYATLHKARDGRGHVVQYWTFRESPAPGFQAPVTPSPETDFQAPADSRTGDGFAGAGNPGPGKPATGLPAPGFQAHMKRLSPNDCSETTERNDGGGADAPALAVHFPWKCPDDPSLPERVRHRLAGAFPDANARALIFSEVRGRKLRHQDKHPLADWVDVLVAEIEKHARVAAVNRSGRAFASATSYAGVTDRDPPTRPAAKPAPSADAPPADWQQRLASVCPTNVFTDPNSGRYTTDWWQLPAEAREIVLRDVREKGGEAA